jgi:hypothetical protein
MLLIDNSPTLTPMKYIVNYTGEWKPNPNGFGEPTFQQPWTKEYSHIEDIEIFFKFYFEDMIDREQQVLQDSNYIYEIRYC